MHVHLAFLFLVFKKVCRQLLPASKNFPQYNSRKMHRGLSLAMPTNLWEQTGRETGRSFLYLRKENDAPWTMRRSLGICI